MHLTKASSELFRRAPDEIFPDLETLQAHCQQDKETSEIIWQAPSAIRVLPDEGTIRMTANGHTPHLNEWSFSQLCRIAGVAKDTVNRLLPETASQVFSETLPRGEKPLQVFETSDMVRSVHGASYTRLYNADILDVLREWATDFQPPQTASDDNTGTGLYCGEQDMFCFLIDPTGWIEIENEAFAPGFFVWNSEVGRRSVGIQSFWFQAVCQNHIVWDAVNVTEFSRKHTRNVHEALQGIQEVIGRLVETRDQRRDGFARVIQNAMRARLGNDVDEVTEILMSKGITRSIADEALKIAQEQGKFTIYSVVDALTRLSQRIQFAGSRVEADNRTAQILALAA